MASPYYKANGYPVETKTLSMKKWHVKKPKETEMSSAEKIRLWRLGIRRSTI